MTLRYPCRASPSCTAASRGLVMSLPAPCAKITPGTRPAVKPSGYAIAADTVPPLPSSSRRVSIRISRCFFKATVFPCAGCKCFRSTIVLCERDHTLSLERPHCPGKLPQHRFPISLGRTDHKRGQSCGSEPPQSLTILIPASSEAELLSEPAPVSAEQRFVTFPRGTSACAISGGRHL